MTEKSHRRLVRLLVVVLFTAVLQTAARAVDCGKPTLGAISFSPDVTGHGILSFGWGFPSADHSNWLQFRIDGALGYAFSVSAQSGTYSAPFSVTCWPTGPHLIEVRAVSCSGWDDPQYETWQSDAITVDSKPQISG